jgi:hypothetical protein
MKLWSTQIAWMILPCTSRLYSGAATINQKRHLTTPKICSITFRAPECRRLKSSWAFCGLWRAISM